jgi:hypothetical protein
MQARLQSLSLVSPGRTVCRSVHLVSHLERSSEMVWSRLSSSPGRCYTVATWRLVSRGLVLCAVAETVENRGAAARGTIEQVVPIRLD